MGNPRVVFFREAVAREGIGPRGAQGVPLSGVARWQWTCSPCHGAVLWLDTTEPLTTQPLRRAVMAQDTGSAISGAVRID